MHGWDVGQAARRPDSLPEGLALELLAIAPLVVDDACRSPHFGPVVAVPPASGPATRLLAYLGRQEAATRARRFAPPSDQLTRNSAGQMNRSRVLLKLKHFDR